MKKCHKCGTAIVEESVSRRDECPGCGADLRVCLNCTFYDALGRDDTSYLLARAPEQITMGQIVRHFDGIMAPIACVSVSHYQRCSQEPVCRFRRVLLEVRNYTVRLMDRATLASVFAGRPVTQDEVFSERMLDGAGI